MEVWRVRGISGPIRSRARQQQLASITQVKCLAPTRCGQPRLALAHQLSARLAAGAGAACDARSPAALPPTRFGQPRLVLIHQLGSA